MPQQPRSSMWGQRTPGSSSDVSAWNSIWAISIAVFLAAIVSRLPALDSWWCLDDWGQLARAAGRSDVPVTGIPARWLSQHAWWSITWPLLGINATAHTCLRILLHGIAAVAVVRIARRVYLPASAQMVAGLLFAATPIAFTPTYWASGIQELLGGTLALLAIERWLATGRGNTIAAGLLGVGSILSKESALALPLFLVGTLIPLCPERRDQSLLRWITALLLAAVAALEAWLILGHFATGPRDPYTLGGPLVMLGNLGKFGWWLVTPGPVFTAQVTWTKAGVGIGVLLVWLATGIWAWRRKQRVPLVALGCALVSLAPVLPLVNQARPYMGYLAAAAGSLALSAWLPSSRLRGVAPVALVVGTIIWGYAIMQARIGRLETDQLPADPVVRAATRARETADEIVRLLPPNFRSESLYLVVYQPQLTISKTNPAPMPDRPAVESPSYIALSGSLGAGMLLGPNSRAKWTSSLLEVPSGAFIICEKSKGFQAWGETYDALLYAAELLVMAKKYQPAVDHLVRAFALRETRVFRIPERDVLATPRAARVKSALEFDRWLRNAVTGNRLSVEEYRRYRDFLGGSAQSGAGEAPR